MLNSSQVNKEKGKKRKQRFAHTVQMNWMLLSAVSKRFASIEKMTGAYWAANCSTRHGDFNDLVRRQDIDGTGRKKVLSCMRAAHNLKQDRNSGRRIFGSVDQKPESRDIKHDVQVEGNISCSKGRYTRGGGVGKRVKIRFKKRGADGRGRRRIYIGRSPIAKDGRVDTTIKTLSSNIGLCVNPIVRNRLVGI